MSRIKNILPIINILLVVSLSYLKLTYIQLHWFLRDLIHSYNIASETSVKFIKIIHYFSLTIIFIAILTIVIGIISVKSKNCNRILGIIALILSICGLIIALITC